MDLKDNMGKEGEKMTKARFNQKTRDFIEGLFKHNNYTLEKQIEFLEIRERQMYHYECDCPGCTDNSAWDEIIDMLNERKALV